MKRKLSMHDESYYHPWDEMDTEPFDCFSIRTALDKISDGGLQFDYMDEEYNNILNAAADLSNDFERVIEQLGVELPIKGSDYDFEGTGYYWFNTALSLSNITDMTTLLGHEEKYDQNEHEEKAKRLRAINSLTKEQHFLLFSKVYPIAFRYVLLKTELDALVGTNDELERLHSFKKKNGTLELPKSAWV